VALSEWTYRGPCRAQVVVVAGVVHQLPSWSETLQQSMLLLMVQKQYTIDLWLNDFLCVPIQ
jgi:hypothetical protein